MDIGEKSVLIITQITKKDKPDCQAFNKIWQELVKEHPNVQWRVIDGDTEDGLKFAQEHFITTAPAIISNRGVRHQGYIPKDEFVKQFLDRSGESSINWY